MNTDFINLTNENLTDEHLCCIIRSKKSHPGIDAKRQWLSERLSEGHIFRKLNAKATVFIEYAPLETAWVPIIGNNYYYLYCLWVLGSSKGKGYGKSLMEYCLADAIIKQFCETNDVPVSFVQVDTLQKAKELPCVFNNFAVFYKGVFETVNLTNTDYLKRILKK